jgi:hypothetical protein
MRRRTLALASILVVAVGVVGVVAVSSGSDDKSAASTAAKGFKPKDIKGKWTGTWKNTTFGSTGDVISNVKVNGEKMTPITDFSGNVFGCDNPPQGSITLKPGNGKNKYNSDGFKIKADSPAFGDDFVFTYKHKGNKVTASGSSPCDPSIEFTLTGTLTKTDFEADVNITSTPASKSTVTATKD